MSFTYDHLVGYPDGTCGMFTGETHIVRWAVIFQPIDPETREATGAWDTWALEEDELTARNKCTSMHNMYAHKYEWRLTENVYARYRQQTQHKPATEGDRSWSVNEPIL